ncbi:cytochrome-c oxidase [Acidovorax carolinensis]|uniref:Cytochrome-c oxidase n=1 Tax=Acidovorax carolinensis TaxID=553814 RepID=A0A240U8M0_9BURK|nr:cytochrome c oxidase subunit 3 family protein [Acidovorax carolinensis]ART53743.1 cytochrome-c oxidase [Acidovorax carolinensis]
MHGSTPTALSSESNELHPATGAQTGAHLHAQAHDATPRLRGDLGVWLVILMELLTFAILFVSFAFARTREVALFNASQATLNLNAGALNTVLLISGSWCVASAVAAVRRNASVVGARWLLGALGCGGGFVVVKLGEYAQKLASGVDLSTNTFYMFYVLLTGFHFLHVVVGMLAITYLWLKTRRGRYSSHDCHALETGAAFWHMVDLLWIVLFPLVYVMR